MRGPNGPRSLDRVSTSWLARKRLPCARAIGTGEMSGRHRRADRHRHRGIGAQRLRWPRPRRHHGRRLALLALTSASILALYVASLAPLPTTRALPTESAPGSVLPSPRTPGLPASTAALVAAPSVGPVRPLADERRRPDGEHADAVTTSSAADTAVVPHSRVSADTSTDSTDTTTRVTRRVRAGAAADSARAATTTEAPDGRRDPARRCGTGN